MGSSPLTRGKRCQRPHRAEVLRLIPAHAGKTRTPWSAHQSRGAHPRSRGENCELVGRSEVELGSSPLTRGKPFTHNQRHNLSGLIPAHGGKTCVLCVTSWGFGAHPRSRGENLDGYRETVEDWGSSPLTRGKLIGPDDWEATGGLIPAHAGKTMLGEARVVEWEAHPRSRGENSMCGILCQATVGSSPLTRGKPS